MPGLTTAMVSVCDSVTCPDTNASVSTVPGSITINLGTVNASIPSDRYFFTSLVPFVVPAIPLGTISATMRQN